LRDTQGLRIQVTAAGTAALWATGSQNEKRSHYQSKLRVP
jgi:hypothetical protein